MQTIDLILTVLICISTVSCVGRYVSERVEVFSLKEFIQGKASQFRMQTSIRIFIRFCFLFSVLVFILSLFVDDVFYQYENVLGINFIDSRFGFAFYLLFLRAILLTLVVFAGISFSILLEKNTYSKILDSFRGLSWFKFENLVVKNAKLFWSWLIMKNTKKD